MNDSTPPADPVKSLLAEDAFLDSQQYAEHRRRLLDRIAAAENREKRSRKLTVAICAVCFLLFLSVCGLMLTEMIPGAEWPAWFPMLAALTGILSPLTALLIFAVYFFRHRRELVRARRDAREQTLRELPRQVIELRREIEELRKQLGAGKDKSHGTPGQQGFTLPELLVVIAILGILVAVLLPALAGANSRAKTAVCQNNLAQIGKALVMYEGQSGFYPGSGDAARQTNQPPWAVMASDSWIARLSAELGHAAAVFICPEHLPPAAFEPNKTDSFGYNATGSRTRGERSRSLGLGFGQTKFYRASDVNTPADMIAIGDLQLPPQVWLNEINPVDRLPFGGSLDSLIPSRHRGGANMLFADSHTDWAKQSQWIAANPAARMRWNIDHQPHPETW